MGVYDSIPVIADFFHLTYIQNRGAAFSLLEGQSWFLVFLPAIMIAVGIFLLRRWSKSASGLCKLSLVFIIAGGTGNLIDRIRWGYVVDYLDFRVFPVFNLADIFVCTGCFLFIMHILFFEGKNREKQE